MDKNVKIAVIISAYDRMTRVVNGVVGNAEKRLKSLKQTSDAVAKGAFDFAGSTGAAGLAMGAALAVPVKAAADMERMNVALRTAFQGNQAAATQAFNTITNFAAKTPYQLEEVMTGFIKLKNMGLDPSTEALTAYGNTASAMGKSLNDMVEAVADAATGEFERLKEFGIKASSQGNQVKFTFQGVTTTVAKNSKDIENYLKTLGNTKFAGGIEAQSKTFYGQLSTFQDNLKMNGAKLGATLLPVLNNVMARVTPIIEKLSAWVDKNPELAATIMKVAAAATVLMLGLSGLGYMVGGIAKLASAFSTLGTVVLTVTKFMIANPWLLAIMAVATAAFLIYRNWDRIKVWFTDLWAKVKAIFWKFWEWVKNAFLNYTLLGLLIKHWSTILSFFKGLWDKVKGLFSGFYDWVIGLGPKMLQAGANIVTSIWDGIKGKWGQFVGWWEKKIQDIRDFLPFSPAKRGPLRDIHRVKIVETIAQTLRPGAINSAMGRALAPIATAQPTQPTFAGAGGMGSVQFNVSFSGPASREGADEFMAQLRKYEGEILRMINNASSRRERRQY